jgi:hypothetical protein
MISFDREKACIKIAVRPKLRKLSRAGHLTFDARPSDFSSTGYGVGNGRKEEVGNWNVEGGGNATENKFNLMIR